MSEQRGEIAKPKAPSARAVSQWGVSWRRFKKNRAALVGLFIVGAVLYMATLGSLLAPYPPNYIPYGRTRTPPSWEHPLGTDKLGRDVLSQIIYGSQAALFVGFGSMIIATVIAIAIGALSGYYGGKLGELFLGITEVFLVMPTFLILLVFVRVFMAARITGFGLGIITLILGIFGWASNAMAIRAEFLRLREFEFVTAAECLGASDRRIIFRHILPNALHIIIVLTTYGIATSIILEAALSFLGFGDPNSITWGQMLTLAQEAVKEAWWEGIFPGLAILLTVLGFNLIGDGLADALNPRLRE